MRARRIAAVATFVPSPRPCRRRPQRLPPPLNLVGLALRACLQKRGQRGLGVETDLASIGPDERPGEESTRHT